MPTCIKSFAVASVVLLATLVLVPATSFAAELRGGNQVTVGSSEVIANDLYVASDSITSGGTIQGDLSAAGGNILVTGPVSQSVTAAGGTITILGTVGNAIRAMGGNITIGSTVHSDVVAAGGQIQIMGGQVGRDVVAAAGTLRIDSPVMGNVRFAGGELYINAPISGNVEADAQKVTLGSAAVISGDFTYKAAQSVVMATGAQVKGTVNYTPRVAAPAKGVTKEGLLAFFTLMVLVKFLMLLVGALALGLIFRRYSTELVNGAFAEPLAELGRGLVTFIVLPVASVILLITVVGVPFGIIGLIGFAGALIMSALIAPILLGSLLYRWKVKGDAYEVSGKTIVLGVVVSFILGFIPLVGWVVRFGFLLLVLGMAVKMKWSIMKEWR